MRIEEVNLESLEMKYEKIRARRTGQERKLKISLEEAGQQSPVIVVKGARAGSYVVIDGHKRVRALKKLKADVARIMVWDIKEEDALAVNYSMNLQSGITAVEEGWLVAELHEVWKWDLKRIGEKLLKSVSWVSRRLALAEKISEEIREAVSEGRIGAHAVVNHLLKLPRGKFEDWKLLTENICWAGLTNREIKEICRCYAQADGQTRSRIAKDPALFLKAQAAARVGIEDPKLSESGNRCAKNIELIGRISLGLVSQLPRELNHESCEPARSRYKVLWQECAKRFEMLKDTLEALLAADARS